jgi:hypothetical protein
VLILRLTKDCSCSLHGAVRDVFSVALCKNTVLLLLLPNLSHDDDADDSHHGEDADDDQENGERARTATAVALEDDLRANSIGGREKRKKLRS